MWRPLKGLAATDEITPVIDRTHPLEGGSDAISHVGEGHNRGTTVSTMWVVRPRCLHHEVGSRLAGDTSPGSQAAGLRETTMTWNKAIVTGASSGIGEALARRLARDGTHVVLVARTQSRLDALAEELGGSEQATVLVADLADHDDVEKVAALIDQDPHIDLVVNNAGFGVNGHVSEASPQSQLSMIDVNVRCLTRLSQAAAAVMAERGRGAILNISSVAGYAPSPEVAVYAATKSYVTSFSQALHSELGPKGVHVTCVAPGFTRTEFQDRADYDASNIPDFMWQSADEVAEIALDATAKNKGVVVPGLPNKLLVGAVKPLPSALQRRIAETF